MAIVLTSPADFALSILGETLLSVERRLLFCVFSPTEDELRAVCVSIIVRVRQGLHYALQCLVPGVAYLC